jgi:uncharacterized DUF497 family protein
MPISRVAAVSASGFDRDDGNRRKCQKHGLAIAGIERLLAHSGTVIRPVEGFNESRFIAIGSTTQDRLALVVFTTRERGEVMLLRPVSARCMHQREVRKYGQAIADLQERRGS